MNIQRFIKHMLLCASVSPVALSLYAESGDVLEKFLKLQKQEIPVTTETVPVDYASGNLCYSIKGKVRSEYSRSHYLDTLNHSLPDTYGALKNTVDVNLGLKEGGDLHCKPAVELGAAVRYKYVAGNFTQNMVTESQSVRFLDTALGSHSHSIQGTNPWIRHAWANFYLNPIVTYDATTDHFIKIGMFDYTLGRGIAYGPIYGKGSKSFVNPGAPASEHAPFAVLLHGDIVKNRLSYDVYMARLEEHSGSFKQVFTMDKAHRNEKHTFHGTGSINDVYAGRILFSYDHATHGGLETELYALYNRAMDQKIEMANDSESHLITSGCAINYERGNLEFSAEFAANTGYQQMHSIDRNVVTLSRNSNGIPMERMSHVIYKDPAVATGGVPTLPYHGATADYDSYKTWMKSSNAPTNGAKLADATIDGVIYHIYNADNRYRPAYRNNYTGFMGVVDFAYTLPHHGLSIAAAAGYASGDANPHEKEVDKNYRGFLGINEAYVGKHVTSMVFLGRNTPKRPLTLSDSTTSLIHETNFSDLAHVGASFTWEVNKKITLKGNVLSFWKDQVSAKYDQKHEITPGVRPVASKDTPASRHYGTEGNLTAKAALLPGLTLQADAVVFIPGLYFTHTSGMPVAPKTFNVLESADVTGTDEDVFRSGNDYAGMFLVSLEYSF